MDEYHRWVIPSATKMKTIHKTRLQRTFSTSLSFSPSRSYCHLVKFKNVYHTLLAILVFYFHLCSNFSKTIIQMMKFKFESVISNDDLFVESLAKRSYIIGSNLKSVRSSLTWTITWSALSFLSGKTQYDRHTLHIISNTIHQFLEAQFQVTCFTFSIVLPESSKMEAIPLSYTSITLALRR